MRFALSALAAVAASLALGPVASGIVLAHSDGMVVPRFMPASRRTRAAWRRPAYQTPTVDRSAEFLAAAEAKRARKAARRLELAA